MLVALLSALTNDSNTKIGLVTAVQGAAQIAAALPAGWAADRYSRSLILRVGGVAMILSVGLLAYTVVASESDSDSTAFNIIFAGLALFGFAQAIVNGPAQALLADSLPTGFRDTFYGYLMACYLIGSAVGPLLAIILFSIWQGYTTDDDDWPVKDLRIVILIGLALEVPSAYILFLFQDDQSLGKESRGISEANPLAEQGLLSDADELKAPTAEPEEVESEEATDLEWDAWMS